MLLSSVFCLTGTTEDSVLQVPGELLLCCPYTDYYILLCILFCCLSCRTTDREPQHCHGTVQQIKPFTLVDCSHVCSILFCVGFYIHDTLTLFYCFSFTWRTELLLLQACLTGSTNSRIQEKSLRKQRRLFGGMTIWQAEHLGAVWHLRTAKLLGSQGKGWHPRRLMLLLVGMTYICKGLFCQMLTEVLLLMGRKYVMKVVTWQWIRRTPTSSVVF